MQDEAGQAARQLTNKITNQRQQALHEIRIAKADPRRVTKSVGDFCKQMLGVSSSPAINFIHYSTIINSTAKVFGASQAALAHSRSQQQESCQLVRHCMKQSLQKLTASLPELRLREASNILWSCAKLKLDPDSAVPGLTAYLMSTVAKGSNPTAQDISNAVWAVATLKDVRQPQHVDMALVSALCTQFAACVNSRLAGRPANGQDVSNVLWAAAILGLRPDTTVLDKLCAYLVFLAERPSAQANLTAQGVANSLSSFYKMRYLPKPAHLSSLLAHFKSLLTVQGGQPKPQEISTVILAVAGLGSEQSSRVVRDLACCLMSLHMAHMVLQHLIIVAHGMAVLNVLDLSTFRKLLGIIGSMEGSNVPAKGVRLLYQALYRVEPPSHDLTWERSWQELGGAFGLPDLRIGAQSAALQSVLCTLQLHHHPDVPLSGYTADAVLNRRAAGARNVVIQILSAESSFTNIPGRY